MLAACFNLLGCSWLHGLHQEYHSTVTVKACFIAQNKRVGGYTPSLTCKVGHVGGLSKMLVAWFTVQFLPWSCRMQRSIHCMQDVALQCGKYFSGCRRMHF